jgi:hypothetical protein
MSNTRIKNSVITTRIRGTTLDSRIRNAVLSSNIRGVEPHTRASSFQTTVTGNPSSDSSGGGVGGITAGMPIGLLLALTYAAAAGGGVITYATVYGDWRPNVRITTY